MRKLIRSLALHDRITVFISSHILAEVQAVCNRVGIIQHGTLRAEGHVEELLTQQAEATVEIGAADVEALKTALADLDGVEVLGPGESGRTRVAHPGVAVPAINRFLVERGVAVSALVPQERNLEDVFLEVTT